MRPDGSSRTAYSQPRGGREPSFVHSCPPTTPGCVAPPPAYPLQEDEIAVNSMSGGVSPYAAIVVPREEKEKLRRWVAAAPVCVCVCVCVCVSLLPGCVCVTAARKVSGGMGGWMGV